MAIAAAITELNEPRSYKMDYKRRRSASRGFLIQFDDPIFEGLAAAVACGVNFGDIYRTQPSATSGELVYDSGLIATHFEAQPNQPDNCLTLWSVRWFYESHLDLQGDPASWTSNPAAAASTQGGGGANESPELEPTKYYWGKRERKYALPRPVTADSNSFPAFQTSAGTPYKTLPEADSGIRTLVITKNLILPDPPAAFRFWDEFQDKVNEDPFFGYIPGFVKCESIVGNSAFRNDVHYYEMTFSFAVDALFGWDWKPVDKGPEILLLGERIGAVNNTGHNQEVYLDGTGDLLAAGEDPVIQQFRIYERKNFFELDLE